MITDHTAESLRAFEANVAELFNAGKIRAPVHLAGGNEDALIDIFEDVRDQDWVCCSWRSHYHCLLKGVPEELLLDAICAGRSITLCFPEYKIVSSAIVGGILPIAVGLAWAAKYRLRDERVWAFCGDMAARSGIYHECVQYAAGHDLPIRFITEDNGISVCTPTEEAWGHPSRAAIVDAEGRPTSDRQEWYSYKLPWPHAGAGKRVQF